MFNEWEVCVGLRQGETSCELARMYDRYVRWCKKMDVLATRRDRFTEHLTKRGYRVERNGAEWFVYLAAKFQKRGPRPARYRRTCPCCNRPL